MSEINHIPGEVQEFEVFDGFCYTVLFAETGREADRWIESDLTCDLIDWQ